MNIILLQESDICSILVIFSDGFSVFSKLESQFKKLCLSYFAPIIGESEILQFTMALPITMKIIEILFMNLLLCLCRRYQGLFMRTFSFIIVIAFKLELINYKSISLYPRLSYFSGFFGNVT